MHPIGDAQRTVQGIDAEQGAPIGNREWDQAENQGDGDTGNHSGENNGLSWPRVCFSSAKSLEIVLKKAVIPTITPCLRRGHGLKMVPESGESGMRF